VGLNILKCTLEVYFSNGSNSFVFFTEILVSNKRIFAYIHNKDIKGIYILRIGGFFTFFPRLGLDDYFLCCLLVDSALTINLSVRFFFLVCRRYVAHSLDHLCIVFSLY
jgi:hypothetical protein